MIFTTVVGFWLVASTTGPTDGGGSKPVPPLGIVSAGGLFLAWG